MVLPKLKQSRNRWANTMCKGARPLSQKFSPSKGRQSYNFAMQAGPDWNFFATDKNRTDDATTPNSKLNNAITKQPISM